MTVGKNYKAKKFWYLVPGGTSKCVKYQNLAYPEHAYFYYDELSYCVCLYVHNVLYVYNCIHEKAIKASCI